MSTVTINGERVSTELQPKGWVDYRSGCYERLRKAPVAIDDLRELIDHAVGEAASAIVRGSPWDDETVSALKAVKRRIIDELMGPDTITVTGYFGGCPECGRSEYVNVGRDHFLVCEEHKKSHCFGANLFSDWRDETEEVWEQNRKLLSECEHVDFLPEGVWPRDPDARALALRKYEDAVRERKAQLKAEPPACSGDDDIPF
jgi:hypothetical protein